MNDDERLGEPMAVLQLSEHIAIGMTKSIRPRGGCILILALDYATTEWGKPRGATTRTLCSGN